MAEEKNNEAMDEENKVQETNKAEEVIIQIMLKIMREQV